jgi:hypothetical protein
MNREDLFGWSLSMIIYDLRCEKSHEFEGWFKDRAAFEDQKSKSLVTCPVCGSSSVVMVPSSISIMARVNRDSDRVSSRESSPIRAAEMFYHLLDKHFEEVGDKFAEVALKIHAGEEDQRNIKGTTTKEEDAILKEAGVPFIKVSVPKFDS